MPEKINCIIVDDEHVARDVLIRHLSRIESINVVESCKNAIDAFNIISKTNIDLVFLDINMPEISGLSFAKSLNKNIRIIFTTAYREYAVEGFDLQAVDYLLKPISYQRLLQAINKYFNENSLEVKTSSSGMDDEKNDYFFIRSERKMIKICFDEILYIESISDYIKIHLKNKSVVTRETIASMEAKLPQKNFIRTHRSFIASITNIDSFTNEYIEMGSRQIPISRSYKNEVLGKLDNEN